MDMEIVEKKHNPVLERDEIRFEISHDGVATPNLADARRVLCAKLNSKPELVVIEGIYSHFGSPTSRGLARVYKDPSRLKSIEAKRVLSKNFAPPEAKEAEAKEAKAKEPKEVAKEKEAKPKEGKEPEAKPKEPKEKAERKKEEPGRKPEPRQKEAGGKEKSKEQP